MSWQENYTKKLTTPAEAVKHIQSGNRVVIAHAVSEPVALVNAMVDNATAYENVEIVHLVAMGECNYCNPSMEKHFRHNSLFLGSKARKAIAEGRGDFTPVFFHEVPALLKEKLQPDVTLLQLSPPDKHGYCSYGLSVDYTKPSAECSKLVIAQINKNMPRTCGEAYVHVDDLDIIVECDEPIIELQPPVLGEIEKAIGRNVASLVNDGDTLQLGIGAIPDAVLGSLGHKKDLGLHTEMFSDGAVDLIRSGVITNKRKNFHTGKSVATFLMGTKKLYDYVDGNPEVEMLPVNYVNDPRIACQNDNLVAINSCIEVDLMGQVVSDSVGLRQISGVGGQVDFVRAANMSRGGRCIMAMPSVAKNGNSKIAAFIENGAAVTTSRFDVDYVVTEHGVAQLRGKTLRDRASALIEIAHPDFRDSLKAEYESRFHHAY